MPRRVYAALLVGVGVLLAALVVTGAGQASSPAVADELGCHDITHSTSSTGVSQETCRYAGHRIIIWSLSRGPNLVVPPGWVANGVTGTTWIIGCSHAEDCMGIHRRLGGYLDHGSMMGYSILIQ